MNRHQATPPLSRDELPSPADLRPALRHRFGGGPVTLRHLCWKEVRQVLPLVWMVLGLGVCVQLLLLLLSDRAFVPRFFLVFAGMPSLFAVGAGVLLVGQEKERRTLDWMRSLPIGPADLMAVKLATGLFALAGVWGLNLLLVVLVKVASGRWPTATTADALLNPAGWVYLWPLQSIFLLLAGFTTAWFFRSSLVALLALIPLALLPGLIAEGADVVYRWLGGSPWLWGHSLPWLKVVSLIAVDSAAVAGRLAPGPEVSGARASQCQAVPLEAD